MLLFFLFAILLLSAQEIIGMNWVYSVENIFVQLKWGEWEAADRPAGF